MKIKINYIFVICLITIIQWSCSSNEMKYKDADVTMVKVLYEPDNGKSIILNSIGTSFFSWQPALCQDGGAPLYEIYFDKEGGDFSNPLYVLASDLNGYNNGANVTHKILNKIATLAGADPGESIKLIWTVASSRGLNIKISDSSRELKVTRIDGLEDPGQLYITGDGTEAGDSYENAMVMHRVTEGEYEVYVRLVAGGTYRFITTKTDGAESYFTLDGKLKEGAEGVTVKDNGIYRLRVDFGTASVSSPIQIEKVGYFFCPVNAVQWYLTYQGRGIWQGSGLVEFYPESWGRDERYKFRTTIKDSNGIISEQDWGPANADEDGKPSGVPSYFYLAVYNNITQWNPKWKFENDFDGKIVKLTVIMSGENYTHDVSL